MPVAADDAEVKLTPANGGTRATRWLPGLLLVALVGLVFGRLLWFGYVDWDDPSTIFENGRLQSVSFDTLVSAWTQPQMRIFIPLTQTLWALLAALAGHATPAGHVISTVPFRVVSLLLHTGTTLLVFQIVRRLTGRTAGAWIGAAIFAVHPVQVEAVAWISGQKDLLAGLLTMATVWTAIRAGDGDKKPSARWKYTTLALGTLAMLAKPQAMVTPLIVIVILRSLAVPWRRVWTIALPLCIPAIVLAIVAREVQPASVVPDVPLWARPIIALDSLSWYARTLAAPVRLVVDYGHTPAVALASRSVYLWAAAAAAGLLLAAAVRHRQPMLFAAVCVLVFGPLPVLGLTRFDFQYHSTVADHYVYSGMLGVAILVAMLHAKIASPVLRRLAFGVVGVFAFLAWQQAGLWHDTQRLFGHNLAVNPDALAPNRVLAFDASRHGDDAAAVKLLRVALERYPHDAMANYNLANALVRLGDDQGAAAAFEIAIAADPRKPEYRHNYAVLLIRAGRLDEAEKQLELAVAADSRARDSAAALAKLRALRRPVP